MTRIANDIKWHQHAEGVNQGSLSVRDAHYSHTPNIHVCEHWAVNSDTKLVNAEQPSVLWSDWRVHIWTNERVIKLCILCRTFYMPNKEMTEFKMMSCDNISVQRIWILIEHLFVLVNVLRLESNWATWLWIWKYCNFDKKFFASNLAAVFPKAYPGFRFSQFGRGQS